MSRAPPMLTSDNATCPPVHFFRKCHVLTDDRPRTTPRARRYSLSDNVTRSSTLCSNYAARSPMLALRQRHVLADARSQTASRVFRRSPADNVTCPVNADAALRQHHAFTDARPQTMLHAPSTLRSDNGTHSPTCQRRVVLANARPQTMSRALSDNTACLPTSPLDNATFSPTLRLVYDACSPMLRSDNAMSSPMPTLRHCHVIRRLRSDNTVCLPMRALRQRHVLASPTPRSDNAT